MTRVGHVLASKYRLEELLGSGGMGHVYRATNEDVGRAVAIKVLRSEHASNAPLVERFLREAKAANLVRHPNVVDVLDIGRDGDGSPFIVQELLEGQDLSKYVAARGGKLTVGEIESYYLPVVDAVAEAHARGVVHRDIKPENVFLANAGKRRVPKLLDFGISKIRLPDIRVTEVGVMMGTPAYMAPEQIQGARDADPRTDVWALGIMLFELLAGRLPFDADDAPALFVAIATKEVPALIEMCPEVTAEMSRLVGRCVRRRPDDRYASALELARDLRHVLAGTEIEPTQRISIPPPVRALLELEVPDLALPATKRGGAPAAKTISGPPPSALGLRKTELSQPQEKPLVVPPPPRNDGVPDLGTPDLPVASRPTPRSTPAVPAPAPRMPPSSPSSSHRAASPQPEAARPAPSLERMGNEQGFSGMMHGPGSGHQPPPRRPPPPAALEHRRTGPAMQDMSPVIALGVVGLSAIGTTAVLMTFAHQTEGLQIVQYVTKPTPTLNLAVHGGLAVVGLVFAGRFTVGSMKLWRGDVVGGRGSAIFHAVIGGALFFAAIELARAAF